VLALFHFALVSGGILFLGRAELLPSTSNLYTAIDLLHRVFMKITDGNRHYRLAYLNQLDYNPMPESNQTDIRDAAVEFSPYGILILDPGGRILLANERARSSFGILPVDIGRFFYELEVSYRPVELRGAIARVLETKLPVTIKDIVWLVEAEKRNLDILVYPLFDASNRLVGIGISFSDLTHQKLMQANLEQVTHELETTLEELNSTNEELETTNEELQSTIEELETTNEELQSTNEELETMNEELQSGNEELETMNDELRLRTTELTRRMISSTIYSPA
jgi:two-component system CheB/CheR fusion protein